MWVLTHYKNLVNLNYVREITLGTSSDTRPLTGTIYPIFYQPNDDNNSYDLAVYKSSAECKAAYAELCDALMAGEVLFKMPKG